MLKVKELIEQLSRLDPEAVVIMQRDPEGNRYAPCSGAEGSGAWDQYQCAYGYAELTEELREQGYSEQDTIRGQPAIVIYPSHCY